MSRLFAAEPIISSMNLLFLPILALIFGFKYAAAFIIVQPNDPQNVFNGIGVQVFVTGLTSSTSYIVALQDNPTTPTITYSSMTINTLTGTSIFAILPIPYNAEILPLYYVNVRNSDGTSAGTSGNQVTNRPLTLSLFPPQGVILSNSYQLEQTIPLPFLVNNGTNLNIQGCFAFTSTDSSATTSGPCFPATFSQNASAYVGAGSTETDAVDTYIYLGTADDSHVATQTSYTPYTQPAVQSSRIPRSLLPKVLP